MTHRNKLLALLLVSLLTVLSGCATTAHPNRTDWQLLYHHDATGQAISGDKQALIDAINQGRPIRLVWPIRPDFVHVADAGFLTVMNGEVFAQLPGIIRQIPDRETRRRMALDASGQSRWHAIVGTTGEIQSFQSALGELGQRQYAFKWYGLVSK
ncbi:hypothetical protein [Marinicella meishanensis]|uniref:hypothetical protein n=1 Tax=Marinicella meishanensis TaxID=2873263 RepID=UPI001CBB95C3|nr:hypothetical protein [Marinicella sp. NBU2979]